MSEIRRFLGLIEEIIDAVEHDDKSRLGDASPDETLIAAYQALMSVREKYSIALIRAIDREAAARFARHGCCHAPSVMERP